MPRREAYVLSNASYANAGVLTNPVRDTRLVTESLKRIGFEVRTISNLSADAFYRDFNSSLAQQSRERQQVALFYFAGHGVQINDRNFLVPVNASAWETEEDAVREGIDIAEVIKKATATVDAEVMMFLLDICRNNPFREGPISHGRGLAPVGAVQIVAQGTKRPSTAPSEPSPSPRVMYVSYSTQPGSVSFDGLPGQDYSPYAGALAELLTHTTGSLDELLEQLTKRVSTATNGEQVPWLTVTGRGIDARPSPR
jgi:uncharacterized caspase-like protein